MGNPVAPECGTVRVGYGTAVRTADFRWVITAGSGDIVGWWKGLRR